MSDEIHLREHSSAQASLSIAQVAFLRETLSEQIKVLPTDESGRYELKAGSHVGFVVLPEGRMLIIEPKVPINTLFALLAEVYDPSHQVFRNEFQGYTTVQDLFEFVVRFFAGQVEELIARGIRRGYQSVREDVYAIRGKRLLTETMRHHSGITDRHLCQFSEFTADIPENQILQATTLCLQPYRYQERNLAARLRRILLALGGVHFKQDAILLFQRIAFHRLNEPYRPALALAKLLLDHLTFNGSAGNQAFLSYLIDMNWLFQSYVTAVMRKLANRRGMNLHAEETHPLDLDRKVQIRPDMIVYDRQDPYLVLDAKYKLAAHQEDVYQMIAYCHALSVKRAVLIHPASEQAPSGIVKVRGQPDSTILYLSLDLSGTTKQLASCSENLARALVY